MPFPAIWLGLILGQSASVAPKPLTPELKSKVVAEITRLIDKLVFVPGTDFSTWPQVLQRHDVALRKAKSREEYLTALNLTLAEYKVSHLGVTDFNVFDKPKFRDFGLVATRDTKDGEDVFPILYVFPKSPADKAGLKAGTVLEEYYFLDYPSTERLRVGYTDPSGAWKKYILTKAEIVLAIPPSLTWLDDETAVLKIPSFDAGYSRATIDKQMAEASKATRLILDLRSNTGGSPEYVEHLLGYFLPDGTRVGAAVSKEKINEYVKATGKPWTDRKAVVAWIKPPYALEIKAAKQPFSGKVVVMVNEMTMSAAEMTAKALRDHLHAPIAGQPTPGAVLFMNGTPLSGGFFFMFPWRDYWTSEGERLEGKPITPDYQVDTPGFGWPGHPDPGWKEATKLF